MEKIKQLTVIKTISMLTCAAVLLAGNTIVKAKGFDDYKTASFLKPTTGLDIEKDSVIENILNTDGLCSIKYISDPARYVLDEINCHIEYLQEVKVLATTEDGIIYIVPEGYSLQFDVDNNCYFGIKYIATRTSPEEAKEKIFIKK